MIVRTWRGAVRPADEERYLRRQADTGVGEYRETLLIGVDLDAALLKPPG